MNILTSIRSKAVMPTRIARQGTKQTGQSAVEIALTLPILLLVLFGIIVSVFTFYAYIQVSNAAREGARAGSLYRITVPQPADVQTLVQQTVNNALGTLPVSSSILNVKASTISQTDPQSGDVLTVTVTYSYTMPIVSKALPMFPQPLRIVRSVVMEVQ